MIHQAVGGLPGCPINSIATKANVAVGHTKIIELAGVKPTDIFGNGRVGTGVVVGPGTAFGGLMVLKQATDRRQVFFLFCR